MERRKEGKKQTNTFSKVTEAGTAECVVEISTFCDATLWYTSVVVRYPSSRKGSRALVPVDRPTASSVVVTLWRTSVVVQYPSSRKGSRALVRVDRPTAWGGVVVVGAVVLDRDEDDKRVGCVPSQPSKRKSAPMVHLVVHASAVSVRRTPRAVRRRRVRKHAGEKTTARRTTSPVNEGGKTKKK